MSMTKTQKTVDQRTLPLLLQGHSYKEIADNIGVSVEQVQTSARSMYRQFNVSTRTKFMSMWIPNYGFQEARELPRERNTRN